MITISYEALSILFALTTVISGVAVLWYRSELKFYKSILQIRRELSEHLTAADAVRVDQYSRLVDALQETIAAKDDLIRAQADLVGTLQHLDSVNDQLIELGRQQLELANDEAEDAQAELEEALEILGTVAMLGAAQAQDLQLLETSYRGLCRAHGELLADHFELEDGMHFLTGAHVQALQKALDAESRAAQLEALGVLKFTKTDLERIVGHTMYLQPGDELQLSVTFTAPEAAKPKPGDWDSPAWMPNLRGLGF